MAERETVTIGGRGFALGAVYAPAEARAGRGQRYAPKLLLAYVPPERCRGWYASRGGRATVAYLGGTPAPPWSGDHWAAWAGEEVRGG